MSRRYYLLTVLILVSALKAHSQKHDFIWLSGYGGYPNTYYNPSTGFYLATSVINFNYSPPAITMDSLQMYFNRTNTSYCDGNGNLVFYTNGIYVANSLNEKIENGDSLNAGWFQYVWAPSMQTLGYRVQYGVFAFEDISNPSHYYLIHSFVDTVPNNRNLLYVPKVLVTYIDMTANIGRGNVIYKNATTIYDSIGGVQGELTAIRHGNGRAWWLIIRKKESNCYYRILLDESGPHLVSGLSCGGGGMMRDDIGTACVTTNGEKCCFLNTAQELTIFDFDRCSGNLSNPQTFSMPIFKDSLGWGVNIGMSVSPNSRFLYISATKHLYQIDLWASNPFSEIDTVGVYDGFYEPNSPAFQTLFKTAQIGPDGKIYISCGNGVPYYHVINKPDLKGDSCDFQQHSLVLPSASGGVPSFPNYRLGKLVGSECDTITGLSETERAEKEKVLKVFPNPATTDVTIDYGFTDWSKSPLTPPHPPSAPSPKEKGNGKELFGGITMEIVNELGQTVHQQTLPQYSGFQRVNVSSYSAGIYTAYIKRNNQIIATSKFAKQ